jgi:hypothetical protein
MFDTRDSFWFSPTIDTLRRLSILYASVLQGLSTVIDKPPPPPHPVKPVLTSGPGTTGGIVSQTSQRVYFLYNVF